LDTVVKPASDFAYSLETHPPSTIGKASVATNLKVIVMMGLLQQETATGSAAMASDQPVGDQHSRKSDCDAALESRWTKAERRVCRREEELWLRIRLS
jgi:hypothetical protein